MFDEQAARAVRSTDERAERVRKIGGNTLRSIGDTSAKQTICDNGADHVSPDNMLEELRADTLHTIKAMRDGRKICDGRHDVATASILEYFIDAAEKRARFRFETARKGDPIGHRRDERSRRNVCQPDLVLAEVIGGHEAEAWSRAGEERRTATEHDRVEVGSILIDKTRPGQASCQARSANINPPGEFGLRCAHRRLDVTRDKRRIGAARLQRTGHDPLRLAPPRRSEVALCRVPLRTVFIPVTHDLVQAATVHIARQAAHLLDPVTKRGTGPARTPGGRRNRPGTQSFRRRASPCC